MFNVVGMRTKNTASNLDVPLVQGLVEDGCAFVAESVEESINTKGIG